MHVAWKNLMGFTVEKVCETTDKAKRIQRI